MRPSLRALVPCVALAAAACLGDAPVQPSNRVALALRIRAQQASAGTVARIAVEAVFTRQERAPVQLFSGSFALTGGAQQIPITVDLTPCLSLTPPDSVGPYCTLFVSAVLLNSAGDTLVQSSSSSPVVARPGQVAQTAPIFLVVGNHPPVLTSAGPALLVEKGLQRVPVSGTDADGDIYQVSTTTLTDFCCAVGQATTQLAVPTGTLSGAAFYALQPPDSALDQVVVTLHDTRFNASASDTVFSDFAGAGSGVVDSLTTSATADSLIVTYQDVTAASDSAEIVVRNAEQSDFTADVLFFVCGGRSASPGAKTRIACARSVPFDASTAIVIVVPVNSKGVPGVGLRCGVPGTCGQPPPPGYRVTAARRR